MKLYEINLEIEKLFDSYSEDEGAGENTGALAKQIDELKIQRQIKIQNISLLYKNLSAFQNAVADEIKNLQQKKKQIENKIEFIKNYLRNNLFEGEKINGENFSISWRKSESIEVSPFLDEKKFAEQYPELVSVKIEIQKNKVKELIKSTGLIPEGIDFVEKQNIIIK
jgi:predicted phage-related endonuclease